ncbi:hypothetical protein RDWZM_010162 [Blomia tropicalis]|uniref:J domain-containing protein n=1 Tax=Blomia tropicalis TaxID=40697 RepID=A0A9Q0LYN3_BLOTA|nr:hypothetical protein RDWZM_010162 [Blomia tropicalis]
MLVSSKMASKFQYDENGTTFYYFLLTFASLIVICITYLFWPRSSNEKQSTFDHDGGDDEVLEKTLSCRCVPCKLKYDDYYMKKQKKPSKRHSRQTIVKMIVISIAWVALSIFAYKVALIQPDYVTFDPFEILGIDPSSSKSAIKKAYHQLSLIYHPDKPTGDEKRFMKIVKAHAALTDDTARKNWEEYGNPDGPGAMSFGIALPSWIVEKENSVMVLMAYIACIIIIVPIGIRFWLYNSRKYNGDNKVLLDTCKLYVQCINESPTSVLSKQMMLTIITGSFEFDQLTKQCLESVLCSDQWEKFLDSHEELSTLMKRRPLNTTTTNIDDRSPFCLDWSIKTRTILYSHLERINLDQSKDYDAILEQYRKTIVRTCPQLIEEFVQCLSKLALIAAINRRRIQRAPTLDTIENAMKLCPLIVQALPLSTKSPFDQLPHIASQFSNRRYPNVQNLIQFAALNDNERRSIVESLSDDQYEDVYNYFDQLPLLKIVDIKAAVLDEDIVTVGALVTVTMNITRSKMSSLFNAIDSDEIEKKKKKKNNANKPKNKMNDQSETLKKDSRMASSKTNICSKMSSPMVHCPFYPEYKREQWWIYITDHHHSKKGGSISNLVVLPYLVSNLIESEEFEFKFYAPENPGIYSYNVIIRSDSYVDMDYQQPFQVRVA